MRCFKNIFILLLCSVTTFCFAQKEDRNWVFGDSIRIDFNNLVNPTVFNANSLGFESCGSISDGSGNLICYSSSFKLIINPNLGKLINRNNELMENGDSINLYFSSADGAMFIPFPSDTSKFYFFSFGNNPSNNIEFLNYSIIDLSFNSGLGKVVSKNNLLADSTTEHLIAIRHANGRDWWLITKKILSNKILKFLVTNQGIEGPYEQQIGSVSYSELGESAETRNGNKIALVTCFKNIDVFDFDRCSGILSNYIELGSPPYNIPDSAGWAYYGCEFSQSGERLYVSKYKGSSTSFSNISQYTLSSGQIINTKTEILQVTQGILLGQLRLGPDNKIYIAGWQGFGILDSSYNFLSVIQNPNDSALLCNLDLFSFDLNGNGTTGGLPNMPNYNLGALEGSACDTLINDLKELENRKSAINIYPNPTTNELTIEILNGIAPKQIEITNSLGVTVMQLHQTKPNQQLNIMQLASGVYFVKIKMQDGSVTVRKFVKL